MSWKRSDGHVVNMRMILETDSMRAHGNGHDQQDDLSVTMNWYDPTASAGEGASLDLILDPGYAGFTNRKATSRFDVHNSLMVETGKEYSDLYGGILYNQMISWSEAEAMIPGKISNILEDADDMLGTAKVAAWLGLLGWTTTYCMAEIAHGGSFIDVFDPCSNYTLKKKMIISLLNGNVNSGGGTTLSALQPVNTGNFNVLNGVTGTLMYDPVSALNRRTAFQWDGDFFVIDHVHAPNGSVWQHWNLPITASVNVSPTWGGYFSSNAGSQLHAPEDAYLNYDPAGVNSEKVGMVAKWFSSQNSIQHSYRGIYPLKEDENGEWYSAQGIYTTRIENGVINTKDWSVLVSVFQPRKANEIDLNSVWYKKTDCINLLCLERSIDSHHKRIVYMHLPDQGVGVIPTDDELGTIKASATLGIVEIIGYSKSTIELVP